MFILDFPRLATPPQTFRKNLTRGYFANKLYSFLHRLTASNSKLAPFADEMKNFDFSKSKDYELVTSIAGDHSFRRGKSIVDEGLLGLARAVRHTGFSFGGICEVEYLVSEDFAFRILNGYFTDLFTGFRRLPFPNLSTRRLSKISGFRCKVSIWRTLLPNLSQNFAKLTLPVRSRSFTQLITDKPN